MQVTSPRRFISCLVLIPLTGVVGVVVLVWVWWGGAIVQRTGELEVPSGTSARALWRTLASEHYTSTIWPWRYWEWRMDAGARIQAGTYQIERGEEVRAVVQRLVTGDTVPDELTITYPEGFALEQMAERTSARGIGSAADFMTAATPADYVQRYGYLADLPAGRTLEGYLFPDTYRVSADDTSADVVARMLATFDSKLTEQLRTEAQAANRTIDQVVIMASILEREVQSDTDMALASGVLWKRFDEDMGLDADATVRYVLKKWDEGLTAQDLQVDSPYNTRKYRGLPPGPISNPGLRALIAAIRPEESEYYYYLSAPNGETIFSKTNDEHNANKRKYLQ